MKTVILNGSPGKNWNTAMMLKEAERGAGSAGAETEYIDLFDFSYTGCRSCLACKRKNAVLCRCCWKDDLSPVIDRIFAADALIIGSPIYLGDITRQVHGLIERLHFCALSYDDYSSCFTGKVDTGIILTMNAPKVFYNPAYRKKDEGNRRQLQNAQRVGGGLRLLRHAAGIRLQPVQHGRLPGGS